MLNEQESIEILLAFQIAIEENVDWTYAEEHKKKALKVIISCINRIKSMDAKENEVAKYLATCSEKELEQAVAFLKRPEEERKAFLAGKFNLEVDKDEARLAPIKARYATFPEKMEMSVENIMAHLKKELGGHLKYFGAAENRIYLNELRKMEPLTTKMYNVLYSAVHRQKRENVPELTEIVPKISVKITKRTKNFKATPKTSVNEYHRNKSAEYRRSANPSLKQEITL